MSEKISRLLDGDLADGDLAAACRSLGEAELKTVERYQLIGTLLRGEPGEAAIKACRGDLAARIARQVEAEPDWLLPAARRPAGSAPKRLRAFAGGFAAAAAIAAVAVMVVPDWLTPSAPPLAAVETRAPAPAADMDELNQLLVEHGEFTGSAALNGLVSYAKFVSQGSE